MPRRARWLAQDDAQGLVEYAVILALTSLGMILALMLLRDSIGSPVQGSSNQLDGLTAGAPASGGPATPGGVGAPSDGAGGGAGRPGNGQGNGGRGQGNGGSNGDWDDRHDR
jgi:Flp pilus assembly pilin Flp